MAMPIVGEARCQACGHDHKLTRTGVWMVCGYCLCDEQKFSASNRTNDRPVTMVEPPELSNDAVLLLERAKGGDADAGLRLHHVLHEASGGATTPRPEVAPPRADAGAGRVLVDRAMERLYGSEGAGGVEGHAELGAAKAVDDDAHRNGLTAETGDVAPAASVECTSRLNARAGIKPGPAPSLLPSGNEMPRPSINAQACGAGGVLTQAPPASGIKCAFMGTTERRGYLFWSCACGCEARIGVMLEGTARTAWERHARSKEWR